MFLGQMTWMVTSLHSYPVKSLQPVDVNILELDAFGPIWDRRFMFVDAEGLFVTQRQVPLLSQVSAQMLEGALQITYQNNAWKIPLSAFDSEVDVSVWADQVEVLVCEEDWSVLERVADRELRLVYMPDHCFRQVDRDYFSNDQRVSFADGFPLLLTNQASLEDLNGRLELPVPMSRFRPNIVISGAKPFAEDEWRRVRIGEVEFDLVKPCSRCVMTAIDAKGQKGREPLRTLSTYRRNEFGVCFGQNMVHSSTGQVRVGDLLEVIF